MDRTPKACEGGLHLVLLQGSGLSAEFCTRRDQVIALFVSPTEFTGGLGNLAATGAHFRLASSKRRRPVVKAAPDDRACWAEHATHNRNKIVSCVDTLVARCQAYCNLKAALVLPRQGWEPVVWLSWQTTRCVAHRPLCRVRVNTGSVAAFELCSR